MNENKYVGAKTASVLLTTCLLFGVASAAVAEEGDFASASKLQSTTVEESGDTGILTDTASTAKVSKKEIVYAKLDAAGSPTGVYIVNILSSEHDTEATDSGTYENVTNLTDKQKLPEGPTRSIDLAAGEDFYYQGDLATSTQLPWTLALSYRLNGQTVTPEDVAGVEGHVTMTLDIQPTGGTMDGFSDAYLLQVTGTLVGDVASNIVAEGATIAQSGSDVKLSYMVFPGKSAHYTIEADVSDFAFDGWTVAGVPLSIALDTSGIDMDTSKLAELENAIAMLDAGAGKLSSGAVSAQAGIDLLASKGVGLITGSTEASSAITQLAGGSRILATQVSDTLVPQVELLATGSQTYYDALGAKAGEARVAAAQVDITGAQTAYQQAFSAYMTAYTICLQGGGDPTSNPDVQAAFGTMQQALAAYVTAQSTQAGYASAASALETARDGDGNPGSGYVDINSALQGVVDPTSPTGIYALRTGTGDLADNLETLETKYALIDRGINSLMEGIGSLSTKFSDLKTGSGSLASGTATLVANTTSLDKQLVNAVREELTAYLNPSFEPRSFVSSENTDIESVQFVYMTSSISAPDSKNAQGQATTDSSNEEERSSEGGSGGDGGDSNGSNGDSSDDNNVSNSSNGETFWSRLAALFTK